MDTISVKYTYRSSVPHSLLRKLSITDVKYSNNENFLLIGNSIAIMSLKLANPMPICRNVIMHYIDRIFKEPTRSYFLFGPRGTGKSTLMKIRHPDALRIDLLRPNVLRTYLARPEYLFDLVGDNIKNKLIIIDEVQKAPGLLTVVHSIIEEQQRHKFILTGSSARKIKRVGADLLGGRVSKFTLHPFMASELGDKFKLSSALKYGLIPVILNDENPLEALQAYINLYLQEEIQAEGLVRNLENFARFLEVMTFSHASILNISNIAQECQVKRKTVENYIQILEDLLLAFQLKIFSKRAQRALSSHPKFYLFDAGVYQALRPQGPLDTVDELNGAALEGLIAQHLRAWIDYSQEKNELFFWRTRSGVEVDFVIYGRSGLWGIEIKNAKQIKNQDLSGLRAFKEDYPIAKLLCLYRGQDILNINDIICIPCEAFLSQLKPDEILWREREG